MEKSWNNNPQCRNYMNFTFTNDMIPIVVSLLLDLTPPIYSGRIEKHVKEKMSDGSIEGERQETILDYVKYLDDIYKIIAAIVISITTVILLPFFRSILVISVGLIDTLIITLVAGITYWATTSPHETEAQRIGPYGWVAWVSIVLNIIIIMLYGFYSQSSSLVS